MLREFRYGAPLNVSDCKCNDFQARGPVPTSQGGSLKSLKQATPSTLQIVGDNDAGMLILYHFLASGVENGFLEVQDVVHAVNIFSLGVDKI
jgi:hypothetical protein